MTESISLIPLIHLSEGQEGTIRHLIGGKGLFLRLASLGITLNMRVKVLRNQAGMVIVQAGDTRIALGGRGSQEDLGPNRSIWQGATTAG